MTPDELRKIGEKLFGRYWMPRLALNLGITRMAVNRMALGDYGITHQNERLIRLMAAGKIPLLKIDIRQKGRQPTQIKPIKARQKAKGRTARS